MNVAELFGYPIAALSAVVLLFLVILQADGVQVWWPLWPIFGLGVIVGFALLTPPLKKII
ncbi:MAG: hypothetical protein AB1441_00835 [Bacillota bacterium]